jgi:hypothetical protein
MNNNPASTADMNVIMGKVRGIHNNEFQFKIKKTVRLDKLMKAYC